jgi:hypothetical protein
MARGNTEIKEVFRGQTLTNGAITRFSTQFPLGEGWYRMALRFNQTLVLGTGTTALSENNLRLIRTITFKTDRSEYVFNSVPGRAIYRWDQALRGTAALSTLIAAASATYSTLINLWFVDPLAIKPEDTVLNTARYSAVTLELGIGTISDVLGTPGTATIAVTVDCYIERSKGPLPDKVRPLIFSEYGVRVPVDPTSIQTIDLERASNLAYKRWQYFACNTTTVVGVPYSGDASDAILTDVTVDHDGGRPFETILHPVLNAINKQDYALETAVVGQGITDFARDGSLNSQLYSGDKSRLRLLWTNGTLGTTPQVNLAYMATRPLL